MRQSVAAIMGEQSALAIAVGIDGSIGIGDQAVALRIIAVDGDLCRSGPFPCARVNGSARTLPPASAPHIVLNVAAADRVDAGSIAPAMRIGGGTERPRRVIVGVVNDGLAEPTAYLSLAEALRWSPALPEGGDAGLAGLRP